MPRLATRTKVLCRLETDAASAFRFLQLNHYPHFWSPEQLAAGLVVRVMDPSGETTGYVWGRMESPCVFTFHVCGRPDRRLPWFASDLLDQLCKIGFLVGADALNTHLAGSEINRPIRRLLLRLGFTETLDAEGGSTLALNLWSPDGNARAGS